MSGLGEERLRIAKLIEHWVHHNDEHGGRFAETADEAEGMGLGEVAVELRRAAEESGRVSGHLLEALRLLGGGEG